MGFESFAASMRLRAGSRKFLKPVPELRVGNRKMSAVGTKSYAISNLV